jgi:hypothetical protein
LARLDPKLLYLIRHRGEGSQAHMALIRSRQALIGCRTQLVNHVRGVVKSFGHRLPKCLARNFHKRAPEHIPKALVPALGPILEQIGSLSERIGEYDWRLVAISEDHCPETALLRQVEGIGPLTALTFVLTREDPYRFDKSRSVGAYLGLVPATDRSGTAPPKNASGGAERNPPIGAASFGEVSVIGVLTNLLAVPLSGPILTLGLLGSILGNADFSGAAGVYNRFRGRLSSTWRRRGAQGPRCGEAAPGA